MTGGLVPIVLLLAAVAVPLGPAVGTLDHGTIGESSGLVRTTRYPRVFWTHNDSGDRARIFAITSEGTILSEYAIEGARNVDWESIASDRKGHLFIGDFGNNLNRRNDLTIYVVAEPDPYGEGGAIPVERTIRFRYREQRSLPDEQNMNFDGEALFVVDDWVYILTKHRSDHRSVLYRLPSEPDGNRVEPELVGEMDTKDSSVTGADVSADGRHLAVLTYNRLYVFEKTEDSDNYLRKLVATIEFGLSVTKQCEGVAWDGTSVYFTNEQGDVHRIEDAVSGRSGHYPNGGGS